MIFWFFLMAVILVCIGILSYAALALARDPDVRAMEGFAEYRDAMRDLS